MNSEEIRNAVDELTNDILLRIEEFEQKTGCTVVLRSKVVRWDDVNAFCSGVSVEQIYLLYDTDEEEDNL